MTRRWPARHPERLQLYSLPTPNGVKASIMLEETGLPYEPHLVDFDKQDQATPEFRSLNPYGKIPAILDPDGPGGQPLALFESGAILIYLAEKTGQLLPRAAVSALRDAAVADVPGGRNRTDVRPGRLLPQIRRQGLRGQAPARSLRRRGAATARVCCSGGSRVRLDDGRHLHHRRHRVFPWVRNLVGFYAAGDLVGIRDFPHVTRALQAFVARPAVARGLTIPARG